MSESITYINKKTGNIIELKQGERLIVVGKKQDEAIQKNKDTIELNNNMILWNNQLGGFVFILFKYNNGIINDDIKQNDLVRLFYLATFVDYNGYIIYKNSKVKRKDLKQVLKIHRNKVAKFYIKMINYGILFLDEEENIKISDKLFIKGKIDNGYKKLFDYTRIYVNSIRFLYENVSENMHKSLGNYFKMIPYIHRQQNVLCYNPDSPIENIKLMKIGELKQILNYTYRGVSKLIRSLLKVKLKDGSSIIGFFRTDIDESKSYIIINPKVFYGGNFNLPEGSTGILKWF